MNYITLTNEIEGQVILNDAIHDAKIVAVEIDGEDSRLVVVANSCDSFTAHRVKTVYHGKYSAEIALRNMLTDRKIIERLDASDTMRQALTA
jgi:hypothetical protein